MGNKTHPIGFRLGVIKEWQGKWFAAKQRDYRTLVLSDMAIRRHVFNSYPDAGISRVEIERGSTDVSITVHTARPGIVIGRGGQKVEELRKSLEGITEQRARLNVQEIRQPELDSLSGGPEYRGPAGPQNRLPQGDQASRYQNDAGRRSGGQGSRVGPARRRRHRTH